LATLLGQCARRSRRYPISSARQAAEPASLLTTVTPRRFSGTLNSSILKSLNPIILDEFVLQFCSSRPFGWTIPPNFKVYKSQLPVVEKALETAGLMLGTDKSRGYCLEMICADFLAGAKLEEPCP
jgi:hypothetical protein